ncbi:hypothetical protein [Sorangium sp. So ce854]|uniref:hypothetical protein n=1 Tax=Sorangium sp. So ce854 TaxID=3133322 RepID=UPI003F61A89C
MGSNKDSDDIRQYLPDLESIRREADPEVAEQKLRQAQNNPELDRALSEMEQQKATGQPLFQFPVVPALGKGQPAVPPPLPVRAVPPPYPVTGLQQGAPHGAAVQQHRALVTQQHGAAAQQHVPALQQGGTAPQRTAAHGAPVRQGAPVQHHGAPVQHHGALVTQRVPVFGGEAAPPRAPAHQQGAPVQPPGAMAQSQWADRGLPPIDKALLPSSLLPVTPPPVAVPKAPAATESTGKRRQWMPTWLMVLLAVIAVSSPFVLSRLLGQEEPPKEPAPAPPSSGAPAPSTQAPPEASEPPPPVASESPPPTSPAPPSPAPPSPAPPEAVEPSLEDTAVESGLPAPAPTAPAPTAPARPARPAPQLPQAPVAPAPAEKPIDENWMQ